MTLPSNPESRPSDPPSSPDETNAPTNLGRRAGFAALFLLLSIALVYALAPGWIAYLLYRPRSGDIVFQSLPETPEVRAIEGATHSPYSHCGMVAYENGKWFVYEALDQVRRTPLREWCARGRGQAFAAYRFPEVQMSMIPRTLDYARQALGRPFDEHYAFGDDAFYSSELIYEAFKSAAARKLAAPVPLGELDWQPYRETFEKITGSPVDVDRLMILPKQLSESPEIAAYYWYGYPAPPPPVMPKPPTPDVDVK